MIRIDDLSVHKNGTCICRVGSLTVDAGERVAIVGANGSGKTTLLRVIAGLERNARGTCKVDAPKRDRVYVHQNPYMLRGTVLHNVVYGLRARGTSRTNAHRRAMDWLTRLGIANLAPRRVDGLSGGERRRIALARALALEPSLLLLDEPLAELDDTGTQAVSAIVSELAKTTVFISSPTDLPAGLTARTYGIDNCSNSGTMHDEKIGIRYHE